MKNLFDLFCQKMMLSIRNLLFARAIGAAVLVSFSVLLAQATLSTFRFGSCLWRATVVLSFLAAGIAHVAEATPLEFRFDAVVTEVEDFSEGNLTLPFNVAVGDTIAGKLSLTSERVTTDFGLPGIGTAEIIEANVSFEKDGVLFETAKYDIGVVNDLSSTLNTIVIDSMRLGPITVYPPSILRIVDTGTPPLRDLVYLFFSGRINSPFVQFAPNILPGTDTTTLWQPAITFEGGADVLADGASPLDVETWNAFSTRELLLGFETPGEPFRDSVIVSATIGPLTIVPEPAGSLLIGLGILIVATCSHRNDISIGMNSI